MSLFSQFTSSDFNDSTIFLFKGIGPYSLEERAARVREKLTALENVNLDITPLKVEYNQEVNDILYQDQIILSINDADAQALGLSRRATTEYYKDLLKNALTQEEEGFSTLLFVNIGIALLIIGLFIFGLKYYNRLFGLLAFKLQAQKGKVFKIQDKISKQFSSWAAEKFHA